MSGVDSICFADTEREGADRPVPRGHSVGCSPPTRGHFPNEQAALKCVCTALMSLDPTGKGPGPLDHAPEDRTERLRHHLRRPPVGGSSVTPTTAITPHI
ncbi:hypothetical protein GCM10017779_62210 [Streptomyces capillispiralis]|nr:hypothetical protein GCM10017779_62210 [Streptomyces capillispiralis]